RNQQLEPLAGWVSRRAIAHPSARQAEGQRHPQPGIEVPRWYAEPALGWTDASPGPQPHADGDGVEGEVEADREDGVHEWGIPTAHAQRVGDPHRAGDDQRPGQTDDDGRSIDRQQEV